MSYSNQRWSLGCELGLLYEWARLGKRQAVLNSLRTRQRYAGTFVGAERDAILRYSWELLWAMSGGAPLPRPDVWLDGTREAA